MRCRDVERELSAGTDRRRLVAHLERCPACSRFEAETRTQNQIWLSSRPAEPSAEVFDALWSRVLAASEAPAVVPIRERSAWRGWGLRLAVVAQAAVIFVGAAVLMPKSPLAPSQAQREPATEGPTLAMLPSQAWVATLVPSVTASEGQMTSVLLRDREAPVIQERAQVSESETDTVAVDFDVLNYMEKVGSSS